MNAERQPQRPIPPWQPMKGSAPGNREEENLAQIDRVADYPEYALPDHGRLFDLFAEHDRQPLFCQVAGTDQEKDRQWDPYAERDISVEKGRGLEKNVSAIQVAANRQKSRIYPASPND